MSNLISRQAAIDALMEYSEMYAVNIIKSLPSAQPDIIYCGDCKYASPNGVYGCRLERFSAHDESIRLFAGDYCSAAERRTDGVDS